MLTSTAVGSRVRRASRRRQYRRRAALVWTCIGVLVLAGLRPTGADASWVAMKAKAVAQVRESVDLWEKHTRQLEDWMDQASGMMQPFSELHAGYRELTDLRGVKRLSRMGQVYRSNVSNPDCFMPGSLGNCTLMRDFMPSTIRVIQADGHAILGDAQNTADGYSWGQLEAAIRRTASSRDGGSGQWIYNPTLSWLGTGAQFAGADDTLAELRDLDHSLNRVQHHKVRAFRNVRRATGLADRYQRLGTDVLRVSAAEGGGSAAFFTPGGGGDYAREADGGIVCNAGDNATSLVTGANAGTYGTTLLAQMLEMDCAGAVDGAGEPLDPLTAGAHVSPNEVLGMQAALGIWEANQAATQLEDMALQLSRVVQARELEAESGRRREIRARERVGCPEAPSLVNCGSFQQATPAQFASAQQALYDSLAPSP